MLTFSFLTGCASENVTPPSQNNALNSISNSNAAKEKKGIMQESLDSWLQDDWLPTIQKDKNIRKKYMKVEKKESPQTQLIESQETNKTKESPATTYVEKTDKAFTLQEYVDKAEAYMKEKPNNYEESNVKKLESLPAIGK